MGVLLQAAMHASVVLGMIAANVRMTLTSMLYGNVRIQVFALSPTVMAVLRRAAMHMIAVLGRMGANDCANDIDDCAAHVSHRDTS